MIKRLAHIVLSAWLAVLLLFGTTAKEYIHLFTEHTDTVHCELHRDHVVIENEHHHCTFLSFTLSAFIHEIPLVHFIFNKQEFPSYAIPAYDELVYISVSTTSLRGPPAFLFS